MQTRPIGSLPASVVGLGCNNFGKRLDAARTADVVDAALDVGITFFDTADVYGGGGPSEEFLGRALGPRRGEVVIATKFGNRMPDGGRGAAPDYIRSAVEASLRRLGTDYIDLYQLHNPDPDVPIAETLGALQELVAAGTVREIGCSNFSADQLRAADAAAAPGAARFASVQNEYSLFHRDPEAAALPAAEELGLAFLPYFPLASGLLTGKYRQGQSAPRGTRIAETPAYQGLLTEDRLERVEALLEFSQERDRTILELAFSWLLACPAVASVIAGATSPAQIRANATAASWTLAQSDMAAVDALVPPQG